MAALDVGTEAEHGDCPSPVWQYGTLRNGISPLPTRLLQTQTNLPASSHMPGKYRELVDPEVVLLRTLDGPGFHDFAGKFHARWDRSPADAWWVPFMTYADQASEIRS